MLLSWLNDYEFLIGTYEEYILGYKLEDDDSEESKKLELSFNNHAHSSSIKSLAASGKYLVTAGSDENVKVFDLRNRREHGNLFHHDGAVNAMTFYDAKHLLTAGDDNKICILKIGKNWNVEKTLLKHQDAVLSLSVHPSGKLALSIGKDRKLITWNLIKGRSAYVTNIKEVADFVSWSPDGLWYAVGFFRRLDIYGVASASVEYSVPFPGGRTNGIAFLNDDDLFALAGESPVVEIHSIKSKKIVGKFTAHETRVRCIQCLKSQDGDEVCLVTASNDGFIKVWKVNGIDEDEVSFRLMTSVDTKCRITCLFVHKVPPVVINEEAPKKKNLAAVAKTEEIIIKRTSKTEKLIETSESSSPVNKKKRKRQKTQ